MGGRESSLDILGPRDHYRFLVNGRAYTGVSKDH